MKKKNILVILTDQQSYSMMSCAGNNYVKTKNLDMLAENGVRFTNAHCSNPVCCPSRFSLMTGLYPSAIGVKSNAFHDEMDGEVPNYIFENGIGKILKQNGYRSLYAGKEHFPKFRATDIGFDYLSENEREEMADIIAGEIKKDDEKPFFIVASFINPHDICLMAIRDAVKKNPDKSGLAMLEKMKTEVAYVEQMENLAKDFQPDEFWNNLCPPLPNNFEIAPDEPQAVKDIVNQKNFKKLARENYTENDWRMHRWVYAQLTNLVDKEIGKVLDAVKSKNIWDDTIIIFTSDHGDMDSAHRMEHKTVLYDESTHIPLIIKDCDNNKGISNALINNGTDLIPTILDYAGIEQIDYLTGKSIRPSVENFEYIPREYMLVESEFGKMIISEKGCFQKYDTGANCEQYFDYSTNIGQMYNQINDEKYQDEVAKCRQFFDELKTYNRG